MTKLAADEKTGPVDHRSWPRMILSWPGTRAFIAVAALFAISPLIARGSISETAIISMLPFAALIAIVAIGQTLVIQQGGLDLSIPGAVTLGALIVAKFGNDAGLGLGLAMVVAIVGTSLFGLLQRHRHRGVRPAAAGGHDREQRAARSAPVQAIVGRLHRPQSDRCSARSRSAALWGIPILAIFALVIALVVPRGAQVHPARPALRARRREPAQRGEHRHPDSRVHDRAPTGWRPRSPPRPGCCSPGSSARPPSPRATTTCCPRSPQWCSVAPALTGGRGSIIGTALGALFLAQLSQLVQTFTTTTAVQNIVQALIIGVGIVAQLQLGGSSSTAQGPAEEALHQLKPNALAPEGHSTRRGECTHFQRRPRAAAVLTAAVAMLWSRRMYIHQQRWR